MHKTLKSIGLDSGGYPSTPTEKLDERQTMLRPLTRKLCVFALVNIVLINLALIVLLSTPWTETVPYHVFERFLVVKQGADSWDPMSEAYLYTQNHPRRPLYSEIFFDRGVKFQYPPASLLVISLISTVRNDGIFWFDVLRSVSWVFVIVMVFFTLKIFERSLQNNPGGKINRSFDTDYFVRTGLVICLILTFYPVIKAYSLGQLQVWINALFAIVLWCWIKEKRAVAGALVGIICLLKPQYSILLIWGLLRKQWPFVLSFAGTALVGFLVSIWAFGVADHLNYLNLLSFLSKHGESFYPNQSINGLLNRLLLNGNILEWQGHQFPAFNRWVYAGTMISSIALISVALFWPVKRSEKGSIVDFSIILLTCTIASPIAWVHHYGILFPIYAFLFPALLKRKIFGWLTIAYLAISYLLVSNNFDFTKRLAHTPFNITMSYLLAGALMVLVSLYFLRSGKQRKAVA